MGQFERMRLKVMIASVAIFCMLFLDMTGVTVTLPTIQRDFHASHLAIEWVMNIYILALTVGMLLAGRLGDIFPKATLVKIGIIGFALSSVLCAVSTNITLLLIGRTLQGVAGSILLPLGSVFVINLYDDNSRGRAMGIFTSCAAIFLAAGPFIGGLVAELLSWHYIFWINVPIALIALWLLHSAHLKETLKKEALDILGFLFILISLIALILALMQGREWGWSSAITIIMFAVAVLFFIAFLIREKMTSQPLLRLSLFKVAIFSYSCFGYAVIQFAFMSLVFLTFYFQHTLQFSPIEAGVAGLPMVVPYAIIGPWVGKVVDKRGAKLPIVFGFAGLCCAFVYVALLLSFKNYYLLLPGLVLFGLSIPCVPPPLLASGVVSIDVKHRGIASSVINTVRQLGGCLGIAIMGAIIGYFQATSHSAALALGVALLLCAVLCLLAALSAMRVYTKKIL